MDTVYRSLVINYYDYCRDLTPSFDEIMKNIPIEIREEFVIWYNLTTLDESDFGEKGKQKIINAKILADVEKDELFEAVQNTSTEIIILAMLNFKKEEFCLVNRLLSRLVYISNNNGISYMLNSETYKIWYYIINKIEKDYPVMFIHLMNILKMNKYYTYIAGAS